MGRYINELEAKNTLEEIVKEFADDFIVYVRKRVTKTTISKVVTFAIVLIHNDENERIYNAFMNHNIENTEETKILQSDTFLDNGKKKEIFYVDCLVKIN